MYWVEGFRRPSHDGYFCMQIPFIGIFNIKSRLVTLSVGKIVAKQKALLLNHKLKSLEDV